MLLFRSAHVYVSAAALVDCGSNGVQNDLADGCDCNFLSDGPACSGLSTASFVLIGLGVAVVLLLYMLAWLRFHRLYFRIPQLELKAHEVFRVLGNTPLEGDQEDARQRLIAFVRMHPTAGSFRPDAYGRVPHFILGSM